MANHFQPLGLKNTQPTRAGSFFSTLLGLERDVFRQAAFDGREFHFAFDQRPGVFDELLVRQETIFADPIARDEMLDVGDIAQRLQASCPFDRALAAELRTIFTIKPLWPSTAACTAASPQATRFVRNPSRWQNVRRRVARNRASRCGFSCSSLPWMISASASAAPESTG